MTVEQTQTMTDYQWLPADVRAFIARTEAAYPPQPEGGRSVAEERLAYDAMCAVFAAPHPAGVTVLDALVGGVPCRLYTPANARQGVSALYYHGGGFVVGGLESHDSICAELAARARVQLISVDYRLSPEHAHPAAFNDALTAAAAVPGAKILLGDSAGGNLAAAVAAQLKGVVGQVLIYPGLGGQDLPSLRRHAEAPMLNRRDVAHYEQVRFPGPPPRDDATAAPLAATDFSMVPPSVIFTAECDPLASDGVEYAARLAEAGVSVALTEEPGLVHGYLRARHVAASAQASFARIAAALEAFAIRAGAA